MAGARIEITVDTATPALAHAAEQLGGDGTRLMLEHIGEYIMRATRERGEQQVSPDGTPWRALSPRYKKWKDKKRPGVPILRFDFHMQGDELARVVDGTDLLVGTNAVYGAVHQLGQAPRPWLGLSDEDEEEVLSIAADHVAGMFEG